MVQIIIVVLAPVVGAVAGAFVTHHLTLRREHPRDGNPGGDARPPQEG